MTDKKHDIPAFLLALLMLALVLLAATHFPAIERLVDGRPDFYPVAQAQEAGWPRLGVPTAQAERFIAENPCAPRWSWGETVLGLGVPSREDYKSVLVCRVPPVANPAGMTGTWYLKDDVNGGWWARTIDGWRFAGKERP